MGPGAVTLPGAAGTPAAPPDAERVRQVAQDFEAMILSHMLASMRRAAGGGKPVLGGRGQDMYRQMLDDEVGKVLARGGGLGLTDTLVRDLLRQAGPPRNRSSRSSALPIDMAKGSPQPDRLRRGQP